MLLYFTCYLLLMDLHYNLYKPEPFSRPHLEESRRRWCLISDGNPCRIVDSTTDWPWCTRSLMDWLKFHKSTILYHVCSTQQEVITDNSSASSLRLTHLRCISSSDHSSLECSYISSCWGGLAWYIQAISEPPSTVLIICILHHVHSTHLLHYTFVRCLFLLDAPVFAVADHAPWPRSHQWCIVLRRTLLLSYPDPDPVCSWKP